MSRCCLCAGLILCSLGRPAIGAEVKKSDLRSFAIPYRLTDTNHVLVRVKINGKGPFNFIIDTGAPALFVATSVAKKLNIKPEKTGWGTFDRFEIEGGAVEIKAQGRVETPAQLKGMNGLGLAGVKLHGIIGYNILARYRMQFDFTRDKMTWTRLNFEPGLPKGIGKQSSDAGGLETIANLMKIIGPLIGPAPTPKLVARGFLGMELAEAQGKEEGVLIKAVLAKGPAARAGLKMGDVITHFQGQEISEVAEVRRLAARVRGGQEVRCTVLRKGDNHKIVFKAGEGL